MYVCMYVCVFLVKAISPGCTDTTCGTGFQCQFSKSDNSTVCYCPGTVSGSVCTPQGKL